MNIIKLVKCYFPPRDESYSIEEKYNSFIIKYQLQELRELNIEEFDKIDKLINDSWVLRIICGENDPISLSKKSQLEYFNSSIKQEKAFANHDVTSLELSIRKNLTDGCVNIYSYDDFMHFLSEIDSVSFLEIIIENLIKYDKLWFKNLDDTNISFGTKKIKFSSSNSYFIDESDNNSVEKIRTNCYFGNQTNYPLSPEYFKLKQNENANNSLVEKLNRLCLIFCFISIFNISSINENKELYLKLNGYKSIEKIIDIEKISLDSLAVYYKIYDWIYSDFANVADKIGIARNILSLLKEDILLIEEGTYNSIQSSYTIYLKDNLNKYIEIRNKIFDRLNTLTDESSKSVDTYLSNSSFAQSRIGKDT